MEPLSVFDIIGPVMVGPSSSHTAGAAKIGLELYRRLRGRIKKISVVLYNSFGDTGEGHGTKTAIIGGILGKGIDDPGLKRSLEVCSASGIKVAFETAHDLARHPNSAFIAVETSEGLFCGFGESLGGGLVSFKEMPFEVVRVGRG